MSRSFKVIGITGPTGAGKGEVSRLISGEGYPVIDADTVSRQVTETSQQARDDLVKAFDKTILREDGSLHRRRLGDLAFATEEKTQLLNDTIFPHIRAAIAQEIDSYREGQYSLLFLDAPTLFESGIVVDYVICVVARPEVRKQRLQWREPDLSSEQIATRIAAQPEDVYYTSRSDFIIENNEDLIALKKKVQQMLAQLEQEIQTGNEVI